MRRTSLARCCFKGKEEEKTKGARSLLPLSAVRTALGAANGPRGKEKETTCGPWSGKEGFNRPLGVVQTNLPRLLVAYRGNFLLRSVLLGPFVVAPSSSLEGG